ncbi:MAG: MarR family transcriptional regulator [Tatlockia sp.]|nr:MarR family transcriptional regulator [Tatlockia sp.]
MKNTPSKLEDHLGYWLRCLSNYVHTSFAERLAAYDVSVAQWVVLRTLYDKQDISLTETAGLIGVDNSSLSRMVDRMIQKDLITRVEGKDRRSVHLSLTALGNTLVPELARLADENDMQFFRTLSSSDRAQMINIVKLLLQSNNWDQSKRGKDCIR